MELILLGLLFLTICYTFSSYFQKKKLPPSPGFALPIFGHIHLLGSSPQRSLLDLSQKYGDFIYLKLGAVNTIVVSSAATAKEVLKTHDHIFASRPYVTQATHFAYQPHDIVWAPYGEYWKSLRKICNLELFSSKQVQLFQSMRKAEVSQFLSEIVQYSLEGRKIDLGGKIGDLTFNFMMKMCFSKSFSSTSNTREKERALLFKKHFNQALQEGATVYIGDVLPALRWMDMFSIRRLDALYVKMDGFLTEEIQEHEAKHDRQTKDFMDIMLSLNKDGSLTKQAIKGVALDMLVAGSDTTAVLIEWAMAELIRNPELLIKAQKELEDVTGRKRHLEEEDIPKLSYLQAIIKETLRLHPPTPLMLPHESTEECQVLNYVIPAKTRLIISAYAIGRDPSVWKEPLKFDPDRFLNASVDVRGQQYEVLPFGSGRRICPGVQLALVEAHYVLGSLLNVFDWQLPDGLCPAELDMSEGIGAVVPMASHLELVPRVNKLFADKF